jgi:hypothetical protein
MVSGKTSTLAIISKLQPVLDRFPGEKSTLQHLFQQSSSFQALCDDYRDCLAALRQWEQSASGDAPELSKAYAELLGELEQEIRQFLEDAQAFRIAPL